jgi:hypothetical protein
LISNSKIVDGQNVLYHYIQKNVLREEDDFSKELLKRLLTDLSIWIPTNFYLRLPVILPYVVRDNSCRTKTANGEDEWGSANSKGFLRDDNSLLKGIVRSFPIKSSSISIYNGSRLGTGFVASHIWGKVTVDEKCLISSRHHMLNSFVPNIVWLPVQISKLTDREGSLAQRLLQRISYEIYRDISLPSELQRVWEALVAPEGTTNINIDLERVNFFDVSDDWLTKRINCLLSEIDTILSVDKTGCLDEGKVKSSRYLPTLKPLYSIQKQEMNEWLSKYKNWLSSKT